MRVVSNLTRDFSKASAHFKPALRALLLLSDARQQSCAQLRALAESLLLNLSRDAVCTRAAFPSFGVLRVGVDWCVCLGSSHDIESVLESRVTAASALERSVVQIGYLERTDIERTNETQTLSRTQAAR